MEEKTGSKCNTYHYAISWKHVLSVVLLLEPDNSQISISDNLKIENSKIQLLYT